MAVCLQVKVCGRGLSLQPRLYACSVTQKRRCKLQLRLVALYECYMRLPLPDVSGIGIVLRCVSSGLATSVTS